MKIVKSLLIILAVGLLAKLGGRLLGIQAAKNEVQVEAVSQGVPTGFFNVKWLSSVDEVKRIHPNAVQLPAESAPGNQTSARLSDKEVFYARDVEVDYFFQDDILTLFVITFVGPGSQESFDATQAQLIKDYGSMSSPSPSPKDKCKVASEKNTDRFAIDHCNRDIGGTTAEQIVVFRTPGSSAGPEALVVPVQPVAPVQSMLVVTPSAPAYSYNPVRQSEHDGDQGDGTLRYTVRRGDSLASIGNRFRESPSVIREYNHLEPNSPIHVGQRLFLFKLPGQ
jgi:hypothetical protein